MAKTTKTIKQDQGEQRCASQHFGPWMIEPQWLTEAVSAVQTGLWQPKALDRGLDGESRERILYTINSDGIAMVSINGQMTKGVSSYGGASTIFVRNALRQATRDDDVNAILLVVDSPGGSVAGTAELGDDIKAADAVKPVFGFADSLAASAAYWALSQTRHISATRTTQIGSIGTVAVLEDTSGAAEAAGVKVHVISTGIFKGQGIQGAPITEKFLKVVQDMITGLNEHFVDAISSGRGFNADQIKIVGTGRTWLASEAMSLGLIDQVQSLDDTLAMIAEELPEDADTATPRRAAAKVRMMARDTWT